MNKEKLLNKIIEISERKIIPMSEILKMEISPEPFILDKMIPERAITALTSDTGKGKSLLALEIAGAIATGNKLFDIYKTKKNKVLILNLEMSDNDIVQRVHSMFEKAIDVYFYSQDFQLDDEEDYKWLIKVIEKEKFGMIMFDTLNSAHGQEENSASEMRKINKKMLDMIRDTKCTILYLHHHRKLQQGERYGQATSRGSTEILAKVASHLLLDSKNIIMIDEKNNDWTALRIDITQPKARLMEKLNPFSVDVWNDPFKKKTFWKYQGENTKKTAKDDARKFVLDIFKDGGEYTIKELIIEKESLNLEFGEKVIRSMLKDMVASGILSERSGDRSERGGKRGTIYSLVSALDQEIDPMKMF